LSSLPDCCCDSCSGNGPRLRSHDEIDDIASDVDDAIAASDRIKELEGRVAELESGRNM